MIERVKAAWRLIIRDGYGQTESTAIIGNAPGQKIKTGSMGRPLPGYEVELLDDIGKPAQEGEICLNLSARPIGLMLGYVSDGPRAAGARSDGFYHTGEVASRDADGYITFIGRKDDVFKASGYRVNPFELESARLEHPAVAEAAVVPSPHALRLAVPQAFLVLRAGYQPDADLACDLFGLIRRRLAPYQRVRRLEFSDLPKTISGKIRRAELRRLEQDRSIAERKPQEVFEEDFLARVLTSVRCDGYRLRNAFKRSRERYQPMVRIHGGSGLSTRRRCRVWDLEKACVNRGAPIRIAISVEQDKYLQHHRGFGGVSWVYCKMPRDTDPVARIISGLEGVEIAIPRSEAVKRYHLMASRIGDLVVPGDKNTVFGELDTEQRRFRRRTAAMAHYTKWTCR